MREKSYQNRLDNLLSPDQPAQTDAAVLDSEQPAGWMWECDAQGSISFCSLEIETALGFLPDDFVGQNLFTFRLSSSSIETLAQALETREFPKEVTVEYQRQDGKPQPARLFFLGERRDENGNLILLGFTLSLETSAQVPVVEIEATPAMTNLKMVNIAAPIIKSLLQHLMKHTPAIQHASKSQVVSFTSQTVEEDRTGSAGRIEMLFGKRVVTYPQIEILKFEQRLEWGEKLDFTPEEQELVREMKYAPTSLRGKLRMQFTPAAVQRAKKSWIGVTITAVGEKPAQLSITSMDEQASATIYNIQQFLEEPTNLIPGLQQAAEQPILVDETWHKGIDYLIPA